MAEIIDKIALIEIKNRMILSTRSKGRKKYYIPGGKREAGETDSQTLIREIKEELNLNIIEDTIQYFETFKAQSDGAPDGVIVKMTCYLAKFTGIPKASNEIEEIRWMDYSNIDLVSEVDKKIYRYLYEKGELQLRTDLGVKY